MSKFNRACSYLCLLAMFQNIFIQTLYALPPVIGREDVELVKVGGLQRLFTEVQDDTYHLLVDAEADQLQPPQQSLVDKEPANWRWGKVDSFITSLLVSPVLCQWVEGHGETITNKGQLYSAMAAEGFKQGVEFILHRFIHIGIPVLTAFQYSRAQDFSDMFDIFRDGDKYAVKALTYNVNHNEQLKTAAMWMATLPLWWGMIKAGSTVYFTSKDPENAVDNAMEALSGDTYQGIWSEKLRWILPFHPVDRQLNGLSRTLRWDGNLSSEKRRVGFNFLKYFHDQQGGYTRIVTAFHLAQLANSNVNGDASPFRADAIKSIESMAAGHFSGRTNHMVHRMYGNYLLWWLGLSQSKKQSAAFWTYKAGKMALNAILLKTIIQAIQEYLNCPQRQGISFTGPEPWSSDYTETCFNALVGQFNSFPGQPASTLVEVISDYYFPTGTYHLNLGGKKIETPVLTDILQGFLDHQKAGTGPTLIGLDVSGNYIGSNFNNNINTTVAFAEVLGQVTSLRNLSLANNKIGNYDDVAVEGTVAVGKALGQLSRLEKFSLAGNKIGDNDDVNGSGTSSIGDGLGNLIKLKTVDLSNNQIGIFDEKECTGTVAIGMGIGKMDRLTTLDFSHNWIGGREGNNTRGVVFIGKSFRRLHHLEILDLSNNRIGYLEGIVKGIEEIGRGLSMLEELRFLNLSHNWIGARPSNINGTLLVVEGIGSLNQLENIDLSNNYIGSQKKGLIALAQGLSRLNNLRFLNMSSLAIGHHRNANDGVVALGNIFPLLSCLESLDLSHNGISSTGKISGVISITSGLGYLQNLISLNLSYNYFGKFGPYDEGRLSELGNGIARLGSLRSLNLENNMIGYRVDYNFTGIKDLGRAFSHLDHLERLSMVNNPMGNSIIDFFNHQLILTDKAVTIRPKIRTEEDVANFFRGINGSIESLDLSKVLEGISAQAMRMLMKELSQLAKLKYLDLSNNQIMTDGYGNAEVVLELAKGLEKLTNLERFNFASNWLCYWDNMNSTGTVGFGEALGRLTKLNNLNLANNLIGSKDYKNSRGTIALGRGIARLKNLQFLDLSQSSIGGNDRIDARGTISLGRGIGQLEKLVQLSLKGNAIGYRDAINANGTISFGEGIGKLRSLTTLDLSNGGIGMKDSSNPKGTIALANGIGRLQSLRSLDISENKIGYGSDVGMIELFRCFANLIQLRELRLSVEGNIISSQLAVNTFLESLPLMVELRKVDLPQFKNVKWTEGAQALSVINGHTLKGKCEAEICQGTDITSGGSGQTGGSKLAVFDAHLGEQVESQLNQSYMHNSSLADQYDLPSSQTSSPTIDLATSLPYAVGSSASTSYLTQTLPQVALVIFFGAVIYKIFSRMAKRWAPACTRV